MIAAVNQVSAIIEIKGEGVAERPVLLAHRVDLYHVVPALDVVLSRRAVHRQGDWPIVREMFELAVGLDRVVFCRDRSVLAVNLNDQPGTGFFPFAFRLELDMSV